MTAKWIAAAPAENAAMAPGSRGLAVAGLVRTSVRSARTGVLIPERIHSAYTSDKYWCAWAGAGDTAFSRYHDEVWGARTCDESAMFEALTLGVFEVGLSWSIVFGKRDAFREAFRGFDVAKVAAMTARDVDRLVQDASIIRNRAKIQATVDNARTMMSASPSLAALAKTYEIRRKRAPRSRAAVSAPPPAPR